MDPGLEERVEDGPVVMAVEAAVENGGATGARTPRAAWSQPTGVKMAEHHVSEETTPGVSRPSIKVEMVLRLPHRNCISFQLSFVLCGTGNKAHDLEKKTRKAKSIKNVKMCFRFRKERMCLRKPLPQMERNPA